MFKIREAAEKHGKNTPLWLDGSALPSLDALNMDCV
ncbi:hypothetical protein RUE5091_01278 [Ruegeria denitrificans]|uniref:Uncharacterized protein n=1 Tax=Ruegeria denitrificans TaxID=1715692 RepID=A0A0P1I6E4_9RHOB|nr:hypothetical protein RUE5091_01278 [Ruegeria denitrificans]